MMTYDDQKNSKKLLQYECKSCCFKSGNKNDLTRHNMTAKHKMMTNDDCNNIKITANHTFVWLWKKI